MEIREDELRNWDKGWFTVNNQLMAQQSPRIVNAFRELFTDKAPKQILEIGSQAGGLTLCISIILKELSLNTTIKSLDVKEIMGKDFITSNFSNVEFIIEDYFTHNYDDLKTDKKEIIKSFIQKEGTTIVLCDGGCKRNEFRILSNYLKPGDVIMAHDYSPNEEYFATVTKPTGVWQWHEISDSDVKDSMKTNNLDFYKFELFRDAAWLCTIKK